jgi:hypothetical protein
MEFQKGDCFAPPPPLVLVLLVIVLTVAALVVRLRQQSFLIHAAYALAAWLGQGDEVFVSLLVAGSIQLTAYTICLLCAQVVSGSSAVRSIRLNRASTRNVRVAGGPPAAAG